MGALIESLVDAPLVVGEQDGAELGERLRRILEQREHDRPLVEGEREQLHLVCHGTLEPVGQHVSALVTNEPGEFVDGVGRDGRPASITTPSLRRVCAACRGVRGVAYLRTERHRQ